MEWNHGEKKGVKEQLRGALWNPVIAFTVLLLGIQTIYSCVLLLLLL